MFIDFLMPFAPGCLLREHVLLGPGAGQGAQGPQFGWNWPDESTGDLLSNGFYF